MSKQGLDALRARVNDDVELARRLRRLDPQRFVDEVRALALALGCDVTASDLEQTIAQGREAWGLRWIL